MDGGRVCMCERGLGWMGDTWMDGWSDVWLPSVWEALACGSVAIEIYVYVHSTRLGYELLLVAGSP